MEVLITHSHSGKIIIFCSLLLCGKTDHVKIDLRKNVFILDLRKCRNFNGINFSSNLGNFALCLIYKCENFVKISDSFPANLKFFKISTE